MSACHEFYDQEKQKTESLQYIASLDENEFRVLCNAIVDSLNYNKTEQFEFDF